MTESEEWNDLVRAAETGKWEDLIRSAETEFMEDLIGTVARRLPIDKRFTVQGPFRVPHDRDILNVYVDCICDLPPGMVMWCVEFHKPTMRKMTNTQLVKHVIMRMERADRGLRAELEELEQD